MDGYDGLTTATLATLSLITATIGQRYWVESENTVYRSVPITDDYELFGSGVGWVKHLEVEEQVATNHVTQNSFEVVGHVDRFGQDHDLEVNDPWYAPYGSRAYIRFTVPELSGDAGPYTCQLSVAVDGVARGRVITGEQSANGVFDFEIDNTHQFLVGANIQATYCARVVIASKPYILCAPSPVTFCPTSFAINSPPTLTIDDPGSQIAIGYILIEGDILDADETLTAENFTITVTQSEYSETVPAEDISFAAGRWSARVLSPATGVTQIGVQVLDSMGATASASITRTCVTPQIVLAGYDPPNAITLDVGASLNMNVITTPPLHPDVVLTLEQAAEGGGYDTIATGTLRYGVDVDVPDVPDSYTWVFSCPTIEGDDISYQVGVTVQWTGIAGFTLPYRHIYSPDNGDGELTLTATGAESGNQLRVTFDEGLTNANVVPPAGYVMDWTQVITPSEGSALNGAIPWSRGGTWEVLLQIDTANHRIVASASWTYVLPIDFTWYERDSITGGTVIGTWSQTTDPYAATTSVTRGNVRRGGSGNLLDDTEVTTNGCAIMVWFTHLATNGYGTVCASYESGNTSSELGFSYQEITDDGDTASIMAGKPAQLVFNSGQNIDRWRAGWEANATSRITLAGFDPEHAGPMMPTQAGRWLCRAVSFLASTISVYTNGMLQFSEALGGTLASGTEGVILGGERDGTFARNANIYYGDWVVSERAIEAHEVQAFNRATRPEYQVTDNSSITVFIVGSSFMTTESGQSHRMAYYLTEQAALQDVSIATVDYAVGAQGCLTQSSTNDNLLAQIRRVMMHPEFAYGSIVFVDFMADVNEQLLFETPRATAGTMMQTALNELRNAGATIVMPQVTCAGFGNSGVQWGPNARADQLTYWLNSRQDTVMLWIHNDLASEPARHFFDQGLVGQPETYGPHLAEPSGTESPSTATPTGKRAVARVAAEAIIGIHRDRLARYARP